MFRVQSAIVIHPATVPVVIQERLSTHQDDVNAKVIILEILINASNVMKNVLPARTPPQTVQHATPEPSWLTVKMEIASAKLDTLELLPTVSNVIHHAQPATEPLRMTV